MRVLVTGGAGYIGSVTVEALRARGDQVVVVDNLATGHRAAVDPAVTLHEADIRDTARVIDILRTERIEAVVHFAAYSLVGESVSDPGKYMDNNVAGTLSLLQAMRRSGVGRLVFSSTAAVYGEPQRVPIDEDHPIAPTNPYGLTKRFMEQAMECSAAAYDFRFVALRYFNACGAIPTRGEDHDPETHLIPVILQVALGQRPHLSIFGTDYDTPDGTCVRDYIHVADLADAHLRALDRLAASEPSLICNLGNGQGYSVREVLDTCRAVTGRDIACIEGPRRAGDPSRLVADATRARNELGWTPARPDLRTIVEDAWAWHNARPQGY